VSSELRDLYQDVIIEHSKRPRNFRRLDGGARHADGYNPLCGDKVTVYVDEKDGVLRDVSFEGSGCAISTASASVMTEVLKGLSRREAEQLFERFHSLVTGREPEGGQMNHLGKLAVFAGVSEFPARVKCAVLAWHALQAALKGEEDMVSTE
jgi:nitrogen fixation NifU-like protein